MAAYFILKFKLTFILKFKLLFKILLNVGVAMAYF